MFVNECDIVSTARRDCEVSPILMCSGMTAYPEAYNAKHVVLSTRSYGAFKFLFRTWLLMNPLSRVLAPEDLWVGTYNCNETLLDGGRVYNKFIVCGAPDALSILETFDTKHTIFYRHVSENEGEPEETEETEVTEETEETEDFDESDSESDIEPIFFGHNVPALNTATRY